MSQEQVTPPPGEPTELAAQADVSVAPAPSEAELIDTEAMAEGLEALERQTLDPVELSKQLEELTGVVLNSAEVSTRSASVAADVSHDMQLAMEKIEESHKRSVHHSKVILGGVMLFLLVAVGTFFAISTRMQQNIRQLDAISLAVGKRIVELDSTVNAFTESSQSLFELAEKMESINGLQGRIDQRFEEFGKTVNAVPGQVAAQTDKSMDAKLQALQKQLQGLEAKVQAVANRPQPNPAQGQQAVLNELQKLKKDLDSMQAKVTAKPAEVKPKAEPKPEPKPEPVRPVEAKAEPKPAPAEIKPPVPSLPPAPTPRDRMLVYPRPNN
jgi:hypothetical protein